MQIKELEQINNLKLISNNLKHIILELHSKKPIYFRIAKEAHQLLLRSMVEALKGTANLQITGRPTSHNRRVYYKLGDDSWKMVEKVQVQDCKEAWRFSSPVECDEPQNLTQDATSESNSDFQCGFYDLLAKIQTKCYMRQFVHSIPIRISDDQMKHLEWLHGKIRNEFEHFIPKLYIVSAKKLLDVTNLCFDLSWKLLFESGNVVDSYESKAIKNKFKSMRSRINRLISS